MKAPTLLLRFPAIFLSIAAAAFVLGTATASSPLFLSSAGNAALEGELSGLTPEAAGVTVTSFGRIDRMRFDLGHRLLTEAAAEIEELSPPRLTILSPRLAVQGQRRADRTQVRLLTRTGALANIERVSGTGSRGLWIAGSTARTLRVRSGDEVVFPFGDLRRRVRVAGIYRDLASRPLSSYWRPLAFRILNPIPNQPPLPPFAIADRKLFFKVASGLGLQATSTWEFPLIADHMTLPEAKGIASRVAGLSAEAHDPLTPLGGALDRLNDFASPDVTTSLSEVIERTEETVAALEPPVQLLSVAGRIVALAVVAGAGIFAVQRRRVEVRLLSAQGMSPASQGARGSLEATLPTALGAAAGWVAAVSLVERLGPTSLLNPGAGRAASETVAWTALLGVGLLGIAFGLAAHRESRLHSARAGGVLAKAPWEVILLALAAAAFYEIATREGAVVESADAAPKVDLFLLLFPILFIAGTAGLAARALKRLLPHLRALGAQSSSSLYLASRRLAGEPRIALLLVTASAVAIGVLVYAGIIVSSTRATLNAKSQVLTGSDVRATLLPGGSVSADLPWPSTIVTRTDADLPVGDNTVDVLGINPRTFARTAFWDKSFAGAPLEDLLRRLARSEGGRVPVLVAGGALPAETSLDTGAYSLPVRVVGRARAFPGMESRRTLVIADWSSWSQAARASGAVTPTLAVTREFWARGDPEEIVDALEEEGVLVADVQTADETRSMPRLQSLSWTFRLLQALGIMAGAIALVGILLYLQARQQGRTLSYAFARRMGLRRVAHQVAVALELFAMLLASLAIGGGLAVLAGRLVYAELDPLPEIPPSPLFAVPASLLLALAGALVLVAWVGAWQVQRAADRANVAEVMRVGS